VVAQCADNHCAGWYRGCLVMCQKMHSSCAASCLAGKPAPPEGYRADSQDTAMVVKAGLTTVMRGGGRAIWTARGLTHSSGGSMCKQRLCRCMHVLLPGCVYAECWCAAGRLASKQTLAEWWMMLGQAVGGRDRSAQRAGSCSPAYALPGDTFAAGTWYCALGACARFFRCRLSVS
jgi:hypothetical protein